jgi:hypothetical protein
MCAPLRVEFHQADEGDKATQDKISELEKYRGYATCAATTTRMLPTTYITVNHLLRILLVGFQ